MNEAWNNNRFMVNGRVRAPITLHSDAETQVAQNAHNLVWEKHRGAYDALARERDELKKSGGDLSEADARWEALHAAAKQEIDALVIAESTAYRDERRNGCALADRVEQLEQMIEEIRAMAEDAQSTAEDALDTAEEALDKIESMEGEGGE